LFNKKGKQTHSTVLAAAIEECKIARTAGGETWFIVEGCMMLAFPINVLRINATIYVKYVQCMFIIQLPADISKFNLTTLIFKHGKTESRCQLREILMQKLT
jgi:hypothetical protein